MPIFVYRLEGEGSDSFQSGVRSDQNHNEWVGMYALTVFQFTERIREEVKKNSTF